MSDANFVGALVGPGRSGTTWAGTLIDSSPEVIYRFEPFHRMAAVSGEFREWMRKLMEQAVRQEDIPRLHSLLSKAHPLTNKEPFFPKAYHQPSLGRRIVWPFARMFSPAARVYGAAYSPDRRAPVIFKEVTFIRPLQNLVQKTSVPVIYLVRHPCATVLSDVHGQQQGKMPSGRQQRLADVLREHSPGLAERFADVCEGSDIVQRTALLWRCEIETCIALVQASGNGMVMTYEQLADDAYTHVKAMFLHYRLTYSDQTERFIDSLYGLKPTGRSSPRHTGWGDKYYSVYRNPREQKDAWIARISPDDRRKIEAIVEDSAAVSYCAALGGWS